MSSVINYDLDVLDLIDELNATGHVTHIQYRKDCVTFHHNAGLGGHDQVLRTWQRRPASAHFNVDQDGDVAQFVKLNEYAWATGNTEGNKRSVSIEMTNSDVYPDWPVSETTWKAAARLAGWIFAKAIGKRPTEEDIKYHSDWRATACPGPHMHNRRQQVVREVQRAYDEFTSPSPRPPSRPSANPHAGFVKQFQRLFEVDDDGKWGPNTDARALEMRNAAWSNCGWPFNRNLKYNTKTVQRVIDTKDDGIWGKNTQAAMHEWIKELQKLVGANVDGVWGPQTDGRFLLRRRRYLNNY